MDLPSFMYRISGAMDTTADELILIDVELQQVQAVVGAGRLWATLSYCRERIDCQISDLKSIAERARRASEQLSPSPAEESSNERA